MENGYSGTVSCAELGDNSGMEDLGTGLDSPIYIFYSLIPRPPRPAFVACRMKSRGRPGQTYHVMRAAADVMFSVLMSGFVLSPSLFFP